MEYVLLRASRPGKAISSDACDSELVAWVCTNQSCREKNQKQQEMIGARFGQASLRGNARRDSRSRVRRTNPRSTPNGNLNKSKLRSRRTWSLAALPHGVPTSLSLDTYSIWQNGFMESPLNISVQPCNPASRATLNLIPNHWN
jgi:hypothetical protein